MPKLRVTEIEVLLDEMCGEFQRGMDQVLHLGVPIDKITTAVEELAVNWQYRKQAERDKPRKAKS